MFKDTSIPITEYFTLMELKQVFSGSDSTLGKMGLVTQWLPESSHNVLLLVF